MLGVGWTLPLRGGSGLLQVVGLGLLTTAGAALLVTVGAALELVAVGILLLLLQANGKVGAFLDRLLLVFSLACEALATLLVLGRLVLVLALVELVVEVVDAAVHALPGVVHRHAGFILLEQEAFRGEDRRLNLDHLLLWLRARTTGGYQGQ